MQPWRGMCRWGNETQRSSASLGPALLGLKAMRAACGPRELPPQWGRESHLLMDETPGTWGQYFVFTPTNLATMRKSSYVWVPKMLSLQFRGRTLFPPATRSLTCYLGDELASGDSTSRTLTLRRCYRRACKPRTSHFSSLDLSLRL